MGGRENGGSYLGSNNGLRIGSLLITATLKELRSMHGFLLVQTLGDLGGEVPVLLVRKIGLQSGGLRNFSCDLKWGGRDGCKLMPYIGVYIF